MTPPTRDWRRAAARAWNGFWFEPGPAATLGICRLLFFGLLFLWQLPHDISPWGEYASVFWMPTWLFKTLHLPLLAPATLVWVQAVWKVALLLGAIGLFTRSAMFAAFALGMYVLGLPHNFGQTQPFDTLIIVATGALALSRAGDAFSCDALIAAVRSGPASVPRDSGEYTWPIRFVCVAMALAFFAAGVSQWRHAGLSWAFSDSVALTLLRQQYHISDGDPLTTWGVALAHRAWLAHALAATAMSVETLFPLALFSDRARAILVPCGLLLLVGIRLLMGPPFAPFLICCVFWVPWTRTTAFARLRARGTPPPRHADVVAQVEPPRRTVLLG